MYTILILTLLALHFKRRRRSPCLKSNFGDRFYARVVSIIRDYIDLEKNAFANRDNHSHTWTLFVSYVFSLLSIVNWLWQADAPAWQFAVAFISAWGMTNIFAAAAALTLRWKCDSSKLEQKNQADLFCYLGHFLLAVGAAFVVASFYAPGISSGWWCVAVTVVAAVILWFGAMSRLIYLTLMYDEGGRDGDSDSSENPDPSPDGGRALELPVSPLPRKPNSCPPGHNRIRKFYDQRVPVGMN